MKRGGSVALKKGDQQGFTLLELMVVFALIGAISVAFLMDIGSSMGKTHAVQHIRDIHALSRAALNMESALKATTDSVVGGQLVIKGAFPHGGITQTNNAFAAAVGLSITVSWSKAAKELSIANAGVPKGDCVELLKHIDVSPFSSITAAAGVISTTLTRANWPISLTSAASTCPAAASTITFVMKI